MMYRCAHLAGLVAVVCGLLAPSVADAALSRTNLGAFKSAAAPGTPYGTGSFETASFSPTSNSLLVVVIAAQEDGANTIQPTDFTISGGGLSFTMRHSGRVVSGWDHAIAIYTASVTTGASMTLTVDAGAKSIKNYQIQVFNYTGANRSSPIGATAFISDTAGSGAWSTNLTAAPALTSEVLAFGHMDGGSGSGIDVGTGWTERYEEYDEFLYLQAQTRTNSASTEVRWEDLGLGFGRMGIAVEIREGQPVLQKPTNNLGLVGYWSFNEGTGTIATDFSGNGNTGTFSSSGLTWATGKRGKALSFDGNGKLTTTDLNNAVDGASRMTLSAWVRANPLVPHSCWVCKDDGTTGWYFGTQNDGVGALVYFWADVTATEGASAPAGSHSAGVWEHWVIVFDGTQASQNDRISMYKNGTLLTESTINTIDATLISNAANLTFGDADGEDYFDFEGQLDEVRIYNRALSASEALALSRAGQAKFTTSSVTLQQGSTLTSGLVGHWTFDGADITTTVADRSGQGNHGYFIGGATTSAKAAGKLGQGLNFDGLDDHVLIADDASLDLGSFTLAAWYKADSLPANGTFDTIITKDECCGTNYYLEITGDVSTQYPNCGFYDGGYTDHFADSIDLTTGVWYHIVCAFDITANTVDIYVDGVARKNDTGETGTPTNNNTSIFISSVAASSQWIDGTADDVRIYNRALTAAEVKQLYNLGRATIAN